MTAILCALLATGTLDLGPKALSYGVGIRVGGASYMIGAKLGPGRIQPMARIQELWAPVGDATTRTVDGGINYILDGHNARVGLAVQNSSASMTSVQLGVQIQE